MKPILASATTALGEGSAEVVNSHDQYEVKRHAVCLGQEHELTPRI
jgi:hypothetical protein